jgi:hypothetical protein
MIHGAETSPHSSLTFGIYPGGVAGGKDGLLLGPPDCVEQVEAALVELQGGVKTFVVRCYDSFQGPGSPLAAHACAPAEFARYATPGVRPMELVLQYRSASGDVGGYLDFIRERIDRYGSVLYAVQITEEANFTDGPNVIDGPYPDVCRALTEGVATAKEMLLSLGRPDVKVGFNSTPTFGPNAEFWKRIGAGGERFVQAVDYVGLDFFPDVFRPVSPDGQPGDLNSSVVGVLEAMRSVWLPSAGIPDSVPIHITEHGWPTSSGREVERQTEIIEQVIRTIYVNRARLNVERYSLFALRDVALPDAANEANLFYFFGIMTASYEKKPAFETFRRLVQELGAVTS